MYKELTWHSPTPLYNLYNVCKKYSLVKDIQSAMESGDYMTKEKWKCFIKIRIDEYDLKKRKIACMLYKSLCFLSESCYESQISSWWIHAYKDPKFTKQNSLVVKLLLNCDLY